MPLDLRKPKATFLKRWHDLSAFTGVAYHIGRSDRSVMYELPPIEFPTGAQMPQAFERERLLMLKRDFAFWTVGKVLRDMTEAFEQSLAPPFVYSLRREVSAGNLAKDKVLKLCKAFERSGLVGKAVHVREHLGIDIPKIEQIDSLHRASDCLSQRSGVVERRDCDEGCDYLELRWTKLIAYVVHADGREEMVPAGTAPPLNSKGVVRAEEGRQRAEIGRTVTLNGVILSEALMTYVIAVGEFYNLCKAQLGDDVAL